MPQEMKREYVGDAFVDHGGVCVIDQLYAEISPQDNERIMDAEIGAKLDCQDDNLPTGMDHIGVWVHTGLGDGRYPVYADVTTVPGAGRRVARIVIDCLGIEPEAQSKMLREELLGVLHDMRDRGGFDVKLPYDETRKVDDDVRRRALDEPEDRGEA
jgi:hypothetical protein